MFRRSLLEISSRRSSIRKLPAETISQRLGRRELSNASKGFSKPCPDGKPPEQKSGLPMFFVGTVMLGSAGLLAYQYDYLDEFIRKDRKGYIDSSKGSIDSKETPYLGEQAVNNNGEETEKFDGQASVWSHKVDQNDENHTDLPHVESVLNAESKDDLSQSETEKKDDSVMDPPHLEDEQKAQSQTDITHLGTANESQSHFEEKSNVTAEDGTVAAPGKQEVENSQSTESESSVGSERLESKIAKELNEGVLATEVEIQNKVIPEENEVAVEQPQHVTVKDGLEAAFETSSESPNLLEAYLLKERAKEEGEQAVDVIEELNDSYITKDGKLVMDFLQAIHEAEKRQHELDARAFAEEKRALKEKYEKELRDLRVRELMRTEEAAMLEKEIKRERAKSAAAIRSLQEKMEEKLRLELEQKENETEMKLKKFEELAKAELTAAITREKAAQIEKMAEANLHINALCMAFYAQSEEARQIHSVHKLALGALALEDALSKGLPIQKEVDSLNSYLEGIEKDSLLHLVLSTLPEETRHCGTDTVLQLNEKFKSLKGTLRQHILIQQGGGGILTHALAQVASWLRITEVDPSGNGIESVISRVDRFLSEGKLAEAADALQEGVQGSKAEEMARDWVKRARDRAITEQALTILQSYATSISLTQ